MPCLRLKNDKPGVSDGFVCGFYPEYEFEGYLFEVHSNFGPFPLRRSDHAVRKNWPRGFWDMWGRFKVLSDEEKATYLYKEA